MYWADCGDGIHEYEVIDGQQRTISICQYITNQFSFAGRKFHNLESDEQARLTEYRLTVYLCSGPPSDKLGWFKTINTAGEKLNSQELLNATFSGPWLSDAKRYFSRRGCPAQEIGGDYVSGKVNRQEFLETVLKWISRYISIEDGRDISIEDYMGEHQHNPHAKPLWGYFRSVIDWVEQTFTERRREMKGLDWGKLHHGHKDDTLDPQKIEARIQELLKDKDVQKKRGIYEYILTGDERHLNLRAFDSDMKRQVYENQGGRCRECDKEFPFSEVEADHITPWIKGGKTEESNCQVLCREHNRRKGAR